MEQFYFKMWIFNWKLYSLQKFKTKNWDISLKICKGYLFLQISFGVCKNVGTSLLEPECSIGVVRRSEGLLPYWGGGMPVSSPSPPALCSFIYRDLQNPPHELQGDFHSCSDGHTLTHSNSCGYRATEIWNDSFSPAQGFGLCARPGWFLCLAGCAAWGAKSALE